MNEYTFKKILIVSIMIIFLGIIIYNGDWGVLAIYFIILPFAIMAFRDIVKEEKESHSVSNGSKK